MDCKDMITLIRLLNRYKGEFHVESEMCDLCNKVEERLGKDIINRFDKEK